jgi:hypothetical protein
MAVPEGVAGTRVGARPSGPAAAAVLSIGLGGLLMAIVVGVSDANKAFESNVVHALGRLWVPGAAGIGPYSGKFTVFLVGWLVSWALLHFLLRKRDLDLARWLIGAGVLITLAMLLVWPPITVGLFVR